MNKALLSKWIWHFGNDNGSLWKQVFVSKYGLANTNISTSSYVVSCWKSIMQMVEKFKKATRVEIGLGLNTSL